MAPIQGALWLGSNAPTVLADGRVPGKGGSKASLLGYLLGYLLTGLLVS